MLQTDVTFIINEIERLVKEDNITYLDAIIEYCNKNNLELEYGADIVKSDPVLKIKLQQEAERMHTIKNTRTNTNKLKFEDV
jgi:hypothetical protein